jgi:hypothetical protein
LNNFYETVLTLSKFWRWFTADLIVHWVRRVFFLTLSGISCVTILKYTLILISFRSLVQPNKIYLLKKKKKKSKGTTKNRKFRCVYMSNEWISKIIWRTNFLFGCLFWSAAIFYWPFSSVIDRNRNRPFNLIQNKVGHRSCFATGVKTSC